MPTEAYKHWDAKLPEDVHPDPSNSPPEAWTEPLDEDEHARVLKVLKHEHPEATEDDDG